MLCAIAVAWLVAGPGCSGRPSGNEASGPTPPEPRLAKQPDGEEAIEVGLEKVPGFSIVAVKTVELPASLDTTGQVTLDDRRTATIISRVTGRVEDTAVSQWDTVTRGQSIVTLYSPDYMTAAAEYLQAVATARLSRGVTASEDSNIGAALVEAARQKLQLLGIDTGDLDHMTAPRPTFVMRAPISGVVVQKEVVKGSQVNPGDVLFSLGLLDEVWITGDIYERDMARVHEGQHLDATSLAYPDRVFTGVIARVSPNVDPNSHTVEIRCQVKNPTLQLKPQMLARVRIATGPGEALAVPQDAVVFETDRYYAFVGVGPDRFVRRAVTLASWNEQGYARVTSGLAPGEQVVRGGSLQLNALWHQAHGEAS